MELSINTERIAQGYALAGRLYFQFLGPIHHHYTSGNGRLLHAKLITSSVQHVAPVGRKTPKIDLCVTQRPAFTLRAVLSSNDLNFKNQYTIYFTFITSMTFIEQFN